MNDSAGTSPTKFEQIPGDCNPDEAVSRAAIYARTSASKPDYHYSIDEQVSRCWDRCKEHDWDVVFVFTDKAESGRDTDRPEFQDMLGKAEQGYFDVVVFWKLDRFCRSLTDLVRTEERLDEHGVALQSVTEYIDTASPVGRFNFRNLASAAELESDLTSQRVQIGMHGMAKEHRWPNSDPPIGYELADDQTLGIDEEAAKLVRRIFRMYLKHRSMPKVAHLLNKGGKRTKEDNEWTRWTVGRVLKNEVYRGEYQLGDYQSHVEEYRIVSDELFEAVKEIRFRFKHEKGSMEQDRKAKTATKILDRFKSAKEVDE
jgi:site-specific DNA recombinase